MSAPLFLARIRRVVAAGLLCIAAVAYAQQPEPGPLGGGQRPFPGGRIGGPGRDNPPPASGTARISGRVISADTGTPLRRAQIRLTSNEQRVNRNIATDDGGRFDIQSLPAGRYRLYVSKAGYVGLEYGQARPFESGKPLDITDGQVLERIDFGLPRGSVITGRITDEFGDPATDAQVQALRYQYVNGERQLVNAGRPSMTDDLGQFRIFGLMPGDYIVRASVRGSDIVATPNEPEPVGYPGTYYPGVIDEAMAQTLTVSLGQELASVAFPLVPARLARISGMVMSSAGRPLTGAIVVLRAASGAGGPRFGVGGGNQVRPDGSFSLINVPPGEYRLDVQQRPRGPQGLENVDLAQLEFASMPISVSGDIDNLTVVTTPGVAVPGRVVFQGQNAQPPSPRGIQVSATAPSGPQGLTAFAGRMLAGGRVNDDGTFELRGLLGPQIIRAGGIPTGWAVKGISLDGLDITDAPFEFGSGARPTGLVVTLTDRITEISGGVRDARGQAVTDYVLVVFSEDPKLWGAQSRYVATGRPNQNGTFSVTGLPPARYLAAVVPSLENGLQNDPALLAQLRGRAQSVTLAEGQRMSLSLEMPSP